MKVRCPNCVHSIRDHDETGRCLACKHCDPHDRHIQAKYGDHTYDQCECLGTDQKALRKADHT